MKLFVGDPSINPFSEWLKANGIYVAIGVAAVLLVVVGVLVILSKIKKDQALPSLSFRTNELLCPQLEVQ